MSNKLLREKPKILSKLSWASPHVPISFSCLPFINLMIKGDHWDKILQIPIRIIFRNSPRTTLPSVSQTEIPTEKFEKYHKKSSPLYFNFSNRNSVGEADYISWIKDINAVGFSYFCSTKRPVNAVCFASFLSGGFITAIVVNPP